MNFSKLAWIKRISNGSIKFNIWECLCFCLCMVLLADLNGWHIHAPYTTDSFSHAQLHTFNAINVNHMVACNMAFGRFTFRLSFFFSLFFLSFCYLLCFITLLFSIRYCFLYPYLLLVDVVSTGVVIYENLNDVS